MFKGKIDIKVIFIFILAGALILSMIFRPSKDIDTYEDEINQLHEQNESLLSDNDSLKVANGKLDEEIGELRIAVDSTEAALAETNNIIIDLENGKDEVSNYVNTLNADGVASSLTEYLNRR